MHRPSLWCRRDATILMFWGWSDTGATQKEPSLSGLGLRRFFVRRARQGKLYFQDQSTISM